MTRLLLSAAIAACLIAPVSVEAATKHRQNKRVSHHSQIVHSAPAGMYGSYGRSRAYHGPTRSGTAGPPWAGPAECYEDLGYGRYESCDIGW